MQKFAATLALLALSTGLLHGLQRHVLSADFAFVEAIDAECRSAPAPERSLQTGCLHRAGHAADALCAVMRWVGHGQWLATSARSGVELELRARFTLRSFRGVHDVLAVAPKGSPPGDAQSA